MTFITTKYNSKYKKALKLFSSGNSYIDTFVKNTDVNNDALGKTYIWYDRQNKLIIGYYNITAGSLAQVQDGRSVKIGGSIHINEFAIDMKFQKKGLLIDDTYFGFSSFLLDDCLQRIEYIRKSFVGFEFVTLFAALQGEKLYKRFGFETIEDEMLLFPGEGEEKCQPMYLPLDIEE